MADISETLSRMVGRRLAEMKEREYYKRGLNVATESVLAGMFTDESVADATEASSLGASCRPTSG